MQVINLTHAVWAENLIQICDLDNVHITDARIVSPTACTTSIDAVERCINSAKYLVMSLGLLSHYVSSFCGNKYLTAHTCLPMLWKQRKMLNMMYQYISDAEVNIWMHFLKFLLCKIKIKYEEPLNE